MAQWLTDRQVIYNCVLQGDTWGSILASVQVDDIGKECVAEGHTYLYKELLPVGFLGLVDDIIGVTEAGLAAQKMNAFINIKTAEKKLQFGPTKCKSMLVGKNVQNVINSDLFVDEWSVKYEENIQTGEAELVEQYCGPTIIEEITEQKYLGFVLSNTGDNMANINVLKKKSIGVIKSTLNKLNSLNLKKYFFECALILMNVMVRGSILYACEMYYDLKEKELRQIERIEEGYLRQIFKTSRGCPITELYLSIGQHPARFEIQKMRLLYLKKILHEDEDSQLLKFFQLQLEFPTKGDWASTSLADLKELNISKSLEEIKLMTNNQFKTLVKDRVKENAFEYLLKKQGSKGKPNRYTELSMAEYLLPTNKILSITEKQEMFGVKNRMKNIPANYPKPNEEYLCQCGKREEMSHIYNCELLNNRNCPDLEYDKLYIGTISEQIQIFRHFEENYKRREIFKHERECEKPVAT